MIRFKNSVRGPKTLIILAAAANAAELLGFPTQVYVTSANDSGHMPGSKHYEDSAMDFRTKGLAKGQAAQWRDAIKLRLGRDYDAILEDLGDLQEHLHVEYDPK